MLYPLRFKPIFREYIWGGRRLQTELGKSIGRGDTYAESWEVVDRPEAQSVVLAGEHAGQTLNELLVNHGAALMGSEGAGYPRFPLLFKFLDCNRNLSVQVHPNDDQAALLNPPDLGKTEAWIVMSADPGAKIYAGLKPGVDREVLASAIEQGQTAECLHEIEPAPGDCIFIPAGTVHALGAGLVVAEIQQCSDTTYRLFDWNRVDTDGNPRQLHVAEALSVIDYARGAVHPQRPMPTAEPTRHRLVSCDKFMLDRLSFTGSYAIGGDERAHLLAVLSGELDIEGDAGPSPVRRGTTALVPASCGEVQLSATGAATVLEIYLP